MRTYAKRLLVLALLVAGCRPEAPAEEKKEAKLPVAVTLGETQVQALAETVTVQGTLQPQEGKSTRLAVVTPGRLVSVTVKEGDTVTAGQVVATLDNRAQQAQSQVAAAAVSTAQAQARQAQLGVQASRADQSSSVQLADLALEAARQETTGALQTARTSLELAQTELQRLKAGARPQELAQSEATLKQAEATRSRAATEVERTRFLFEKGVLARRQFEDAQTALAVAEGAVETARQQRALLKEGTRSEELQAAELRVRQAQEALHQAETTGTARLAQAEAARRQARQGALQVAAKQQEARAQQQTLAQRRAEQSATAIQSSYAALRAPLSGIVTRRALQPGDLADPATPLLEIVDTRVVNLVASVAAADASRVQVGMSATVETEAGSASARVQSLGQVDPQTNLQTVRLVVSNTAGKLKLGAFVTARITVRRTPQAVVVPKGAVVNKEGKDVVFVVDAENKAHAKELVLGLEQETVVEVRSGLKAGEKIVVTGGHELADGTLVQAEEKDEPKEKGEK